MSPAHWGCWRHRRNGLAAKSWAARLAGSSPPPPPFRQGRGSEQSRLRSTQDVFPTTVFSASPPGLSPPPISLAELCLFRRVTAWGISERRSASEAWAPWESLQLSCLGDGSFAHRPLLKQGPGPRGTVAGGVGVLCPSTSPATPWLELPPVSLTRKKGFGASGETCSDGGGGAGKSFGRVPLQGPPPLTEGTPGHHVGDTQFGTRGSPKTFVSDS